MKAFNFKSAKRERSSLVSPCMHRYQVLRTCGNVHAGTHTCVTPYAWQREAREWPSSLCRDRARCRSCDFRNGETPPVVDRCGKRRSSRVAEEDRGTIVTGNSTIGENRSVIFPARERNVGLHRRLLLLVRRITAPGAADDDTPG